MSNYTSYGTLGGGNFTLTVPAEKGERPEKTPSGLIATRAVETRDGWRGQVIVDKTIVFESDAISGEDAAEDAMKVANSRVVTAIKTLFDLVTATDEAVEITTAEDAA